MPKLITHTAFEFLQGCHNIRQRGTTFNKTLLMIASETQIKLIAILILIMFRATTEEIMTIMSSKSWQEDMKKWLCKIRKIIISSIYLMIKFWTHIEMLTTSKVIHSFNPHSICIIIVRFDETVVMRLTMTITMTVNIRCSNIHSNQKQSKHKCNSYVLNNSSVKIACQNKNGCLNCSAYNSYKKRMQEM